LNCEEEGNLNPENEMPSTAGVINEQNEDALSEVSTIIETLHRTDPYIGSSEEARISSRHLVWNKDLVRGYRINYKTWPATFKSLF
jgi:hypothetical protein